MTAFRTRGHPTAIAAVQAMVRGHMPHALLLLGPRGVGKTTLATDIAAGLLCTDPDPGARPCGGCRACRLVASDGHPDVHRLSPEGAGSQIVIGGPGASGRGIRDLIRDLALTPVEGGARVAIVTAAHRMNEDAQAALLKTLEEPSSGVTIILCADVEDSLLPTIRSRSACLRLGPVSGREVEALLTERDGTDPPLAARLARIAAGRPGIAIAWAGRPDAVLARGQLARTLLDLADQRPSERLASIRAAIPLAALVAGLHDAPATAGTGRRGTKAMAASRPPDRSAADDPASDGADAEAVTPARATAADRRRSIEAILTVWTDVARDVVVIARGMPGAAHDIGLLDESTATAARLDPDRVLRFLERLGRATTRLAGNVGPELILDDLVLAWPASRS